MCVSVGWSFTLVPGGNTFPPRPMVLPFSVTIEDALYEWKGHYSPGTGIQIDDPGGPGAA